VLATVTKPGGRQADRAAFLRVPVYLKAVPILRPLGIHTNARVAVRPDHVQHRDVWIFDLKRGDGLTPGGQPDGRTDDLELDGILPVPFPPHS